MASGMAEGDFFSEFYTEDRIAAFEKLSGKGYIGSQGQVVTEEIAPLLGLKEGDKVLDIGSGIGGFAFHLAKNFGADVLGLDVSSDVVRAARKRAALADLGKGQVKFDEIDVTKAVFSPATFDLVIIRSALLHFPNTNKTSTIQKAFEWLKAGGRLMLNDMCTVQDVSFPELDEHAKKRRWYLLSLKEHQQMVEDAGFRCVQITDRYETYVRLINEEIASVEERREELLKDVPRDMYEDTLVHWKWKKNWVEKKGFTEFYILAEKEKP
eukprot:m.171649 g.171649  ORF g.171649 m.171649 type:complete len:268 (+) comp39064_c0_seq2:58-861(+)